MHAFRNNASACYYSHPVHPAFLVVELFPPTGVARPRIRARLRGLPLTEPQTSLLDCQHGHSPERG